MLFLKAVRILVTHNGEPLGGFRESSSFTQDWETWVQHKGIYLLHPRHAPVPAGCAVWALGEEKHFPGMSTTLSSVYPGVSPVLHENGDSDLLYQPVQSTLLMDPHVTVQPSIN